MGRKERLSFKKFSEILLLVERVKNGSICIRKGCKRFVNCIVVDFVKEH